MTLIQQLSVEAGLKAEQDLLASVCAAELEAGVLFWQPTDRALVMPRRLSRLPGFEQASAELAASGWPILLRETGGEPVPQSAATINIALVYAPARTEGDQGRIETAYRRLCEPICDLLTELGAWRLWGSRRRVLRWSLQRQPECAKAGGNCAALAAEPGRAAACGPGSRSITG